MDAHGGAPTFRKTYAIINTPITCAARPPARPPRRAHPARARHASSRPRASAALTPAAAPLQAGTEISVEISNGHYRTVEGVWWNSFTDAPQTTLYPVTGFQGTKSVVLSTTEWVGGKNDFLGVAYVVVGVICLVLAMGFTIKDRCSPRKEGDAAYLRQKGEK